MSKISKILIGTHNKGKFKELSYLLPENLKKITPKSIGIRSPKETGKTFSANSKLKVNYFYKRSKIVSISDDSGLSINCLGGRPGINSARWAIKNGGFKNAMKKILLMIDKKNINKKKKNRKAIFVCSLSLRLSNSKLVIAEGKIKGKISKKIIGKNGFGYDPIFIPNNYKLTFGQMSKKKKMLMDHRFIAFKKLRKKINIF
ncbi:MAG: non-canonical purine NTP pyrophosphatase [Pelagibacteraceae bacterium]